MKTERVITTQWGENNFLCNLRLFLLKSIIRSFQLFYWLCKKFRIRFPFVDSFDIIKDPRLMIAKGMPKAFFIIRHKGFDVPPQFFNCDIASYSQGK